MMNHVQPAKEIVIMTVIALEISNVGKIQCSLILVYISTMHQDVMGCIELIPAMIRTTLKMSS